MTDDIARLGLQRHPEGGWFRETWRSPVDVTLSDGRVRATATLIHFFLPAGESSAWHVVASDEMWIAQSGAVALELGGAGEEPTDEVERLTCAVDDQPQVLVPAGVWQRTVASDTDALVSCLVSPGVDFADFRLAD